MARDFRRLAVLAAKSASDKLAEEIVLFHIKPMSGIADFLLLATVDSPAQLEAVEDHVSRQFKTKGVSLVRRDGARSALWRVLDYGGLIVHLMHRDAREFYSLDKLYIDARRLSWAEAPAKANRSKEAGTRRRS
jgi:ribosome-associated protein